MDRVFLDASVLFAAAYRARAGIRCLWSLADVELVTTSYVCREVESNLLEVDEQGRPKEPEQVRIEKLDRFLALLRSVQIAADPADRPLPDGIELPEKDRPILLAAIACQATHLLTADKQHFGAHSGKTIEGVLVLPPDQFLKSRSHGS